MNDRDKLMELLKKADNIASKKLIMDYDDAIADNADYLIAHGVTVQEWISVKDRLPNFDEKEMEKYKYFGYKFFAEFNVMISGATKPTTLYHDGKDWYDEEGKCYCVTHWQYLPQPPKGE